MPNLNDLAQEVLMREMAAHPEQYQPKAPLAASRPERTIDPEIAALLGGTADAASTYAFLKAGAGTEGNPILRGAFQHHPLKTALGVGAGSLGLMALRNLLRSKGGKTGSAIADLLASQQGAEQMGLAAANFDSLHVPYPGRAQRRMDPRSSTEITHDRLRAGVTR
jgi:hypothetical protein